MPIWLPVSSGTDIATYSEVRTFMMEDHTVINDYMSITTSWNNTISLTGNHLIYARKNSTKKFNPV